MLKNLRKELENAGRPDKVPVYQNFFKTGKGQYGEGDIFLGISMPEQRKIAKEYTNLSLQEIQTLLESKIHEHRMTALIILVEKYKKGSEKEKEEYYKFYIKNAKNVNNWDLVDVTCHKIVGTHLLHKNRDILYTLAKSTNLWERRIAIVSTAAFIAQHDFKETLNISEILLNDKHDLIHKAVGWMLREVGKRDQKIEEQFLDKHHKTMPRTMLRYAIEKFDEKKRKEYMKK